MPGVQDQPKEYEAVRPCGALAAVALDGRPVAVVADGAPWQLPLARALKERGAVGRACRSVGELEDAVAAETPCAVIADDTTPAVDGLEVLERASEAGGLPVILLAEWTDPRRADELLERGAFACIDAGDPDSAVLRALRELAKAAFLCDALERERELNAKLKRQTRSFGHIVRERTRRLLRAYAELKRLDKLKLDLIALISHQIRTPLCTILGQSDLILTGCSRDEEELHSRVRSIREQGQRIGRFVEDATTFLAYRLGERPRRESEFSLSCVVAQARDWLSAKASAKGIRIGADVPADLVVSSDFEQVSDMVCRILDNAITYSPQGSSVRICAEAAVDGIALEVTDEGCGIDPEVLYRLFKPFELARDVRHHSDGNGMSLAICHEALKALGGRVELHSEGRGRGCVVRVLLPAVPQTEAEARETVGEAG